jgi:hypothetical protein
MLIINVLNHSTYQMQSLREITTKQWLTHMSRFPHLTYQTHFQLQDKQIVIMFNFQSLWSLRNILASLPSVPIFWNVVTVSPLIGQAIDSTPWSG